jgi:hypothetical protein
MIFNSNEEKINKKLNVIILFLNVMVFFFIIIIQMRIVVLIFGFLLKWTLNFRVLKN